MGGWIKEEADYNYSNDSGGRYWIPSDEDAVTVSHNYKN